LETGRLGDWETGRLGDWETWRLGDLETWRLGDWETGRLGEAGAMKIRKHTEQEVYKKGQDAAMEIFLLSKQFPKGEIYSLTDQVRRSSRSVCANIAEAWRKRRYEGAFIAKLSDAEGEAAETQVWIEFAVKCNYLPRNCGTTLYRTYDEIIRMLVAMIHDAKSWTL
jgi:four helix bundle protein